jgi:hypothetical protein
MVASDPTVERSRVEDDEGEFAVTLVLELLRPPGKGEGIETVRANYESTRPVRGDPLRIAALSIRLACRASARSGERSTKPAPDRQTVVSPHFHNGPMRRSVLTRSSSGTARTLTWTEDPAASIIASEILSDLSG